MPRLFGTDGVRGVAGVDLTADLARSLAAAAVHELGRTGVAVVGRDPRPSGGWLQDAVVEGLTSAGSDVVLLGVIPTPAVALAVAGGLPRLDGPPDFGVVISASHNPAPDNGIKLFGAGGTKLSEAAEAAVEAALDRIGAVGGGAVIADLSDDTRWYVDSLLASLPNPLDGLRVVVDCANGAAATMAADVYGAAGADVLVINDDLAGDHINDHCGATDLEALRAAVLATGAAAGIAHDGDADRCLAVTAQGEVADGDAILAVLATGMQQQGVLRGDRIAATVMSNLGLHRALATHGISVAVTPVGDRQVTERMRAEGLALGGEQSGHIVMLDHSTTGDGILTGLHLLARMAATGQPLEALVAPVQRLPQVLLNVPVTDRDAALAAIGPMVAVIAAELGADGRVLVRPSGTEPLVRVMVEATTQRQARALAEQLADAIR